MKQRYVLSLPLFLLLFFAGQNSIAQEWTYSGPTDNLNAANDSWADENGNSYHNITAFAKRNSFGSIAKKHLLILDKSGHFNGMVVINDCESRAPLLPFFFGHFLTSDYNCNQDTADTRDSRVFDRQGKLVLQGEAFSMHRMAHVRTEEGYTIFTQSGFSSDEPSIELRNIDWDFNIEDKNLDISELKVPGKGMTNNQRLLPVQGADGRWLVPIFYGEKKGKVRLSLEWNIVYLTDGDQIFGQFRADDDKDIIASQPFGDGYALLAGSSVGTKTVYFLDKDAKETRRLDIRPKGRFDHFLLAHDRLLVLSAIYENALPKAYLISVFDLDGKLLEERCLHTNDRVWVQSFVPFGETSVLLAGSIMPSEEERYSVIWKLDIVEQPAAEPDVEPAATVIEKQSPIESMTVEELSEEAMSVAVYPNPASIYLNFALKNPIAEAQSFQLRVFSMDGKLAHQDIFTGAFYELDVSDFPPGAYSYQIFDTRSKKDFLSGKFIKSR